MSEEAIRTCKVSTHLPNLVVNKPPRRCLPSQEYDLDCPKCIACGMGENSVQHWTSWCPVPLLMVLYFLSPKADWAATLQTACDGSRKSTVVVANVLNQFRRLLIQYGEMKHAHSRSTNVNTFEGEGDIDFWVNALGQATSHSFHVLYKMKWGVSGIADNSLAITDDVLLTLKGSIPLCINAAPQPDLQVHASRNIIRLDTTLGASIWLLCSAARSETTVVKRPKKSSFKTRSRATGPTNWWRALRLSKFNLEIV